MIFLSEQSSKYKESIKKFLNEKFYKKLLSPNPQLFFCNFTMKQTINDMK